MHVTICGTGAMACLFGARLAGNAEVTLAGHWMEGIDAIRSKGITVSGGPSVPSGKITATPLNASIAPADLVLVLAKSWQTANIAERLPQLTKPGGVVLTLQNGLGNCELLGPTACLGTTGEGATLLGPGVVRYGGSGATVAAAPQWVVDLLQAGGFDARRCEVGEAMGMVWNKLAINCGVNALTALLRVPNGDLLNRPAAALLMERAAIECIDIARARGISPLSEDPAALVRDAATRTAANKSSMLQDVERGAPTECDAINGAVARAARQAGMSAPINEVLWLLVKAAVSDFGEDRS